VQIKQDKFFKVSLRNDHSSRSNLHSFQSHHLEEERKGLSFRNGKGAPSTVEVTSYILHVLPNNSFIFFHSALKTLRANRTAKRVNSPQLSLRNTKDNGTGIWASPVEEPSQPAYPEVEFTVDKCQHRASNLLLDALGLL
jgi:hypothetical protein